MAMFYEQGQKFDAEMEADFARNEFKLDFSKKSYEDEILEDFLAIDRKNRNAENGVLNTWKRMGL